MLSKEKFSLMAAEFIGTAMLALAVLVTSNIFGLGTAAWYVSLTAGATLALIVAKLGHVSGAHVNPAVTLGLWTMKKTPSSTALVYIAAQLLGGACALAFYNYATNDTLAASGASSFEWRVFWLEMTGAMVFGAGIASAVVQKLEGVYAALIIGASLAAGALLASLAAPGFLNPAVALANDAWDKTVVIAPIVGMIVGMNVYTYLFAPTKKKKSRS
jgi:glycerol uptake facilitator-like aquaporin